jgi:hypothetical protein
LRKWLILVLQIRINRWPEPSCNPRKKEVQISKHHHTIMGYVKSTKSQMKELPMTKAGTI